MSTQNLIDVSQIDGFITFIQSIDWSDPWLIGLITFHISIFIMAVFTRNYGNFQALLFLCLLLLVYFSEKINKIASDNWEMFSRQAYFDSNGLFISVVFSTPILLNCMLMVGSWLYQSTQLMRHIKLAQLKERSIKNERRLLNDSKED